MNSICLQLCVLTLSLIGYGFAQPVAQKAASLCAGESGISEWLEYSNDDLHLSFKYPPRYHVAKVTWRNQGEFKLLVSLRNKNNGAIISLGTMSGTLDPQKLPPYAPTGVMKPPTLIKIGDRQFYYYGRGGGGVSYPDQYFWSDGINTYQAIFDGPYSASHDPNFPPNSPTRCTKRLENALLNTFTSSSR